VVGRLVRAPIWYTPHQFVAAHAEVWNWCGGAGMFERKAK